MVNGVLGAWDGVFDKDWFTMYPGTSVLSRYYICSDFPTNEDCVDVSRDMRFKNSFKC